MRESPSPDSGADARTIPDDHRNHEADEYAHLGCAHKGEHMDSLTIPVCNCPDNEFPHVHAHAIANRIRASLITGSVYPINVPLPDRDPDRRSSVAEEAPKGIHRPGGD